MPGRVLESNVSEGKLVSAGDVLLRIDDRELQLQLNQAEAQIVAVEEEINGLTEQLQTWEHHLSTATDNLERVRNLRESQAVSDRAVDEAENAFEETRGQVKTLEASIAQTNARLELARQEAELLKLRLEKCRVIAPITGTVLDEGIEVGEYVAPGRVVLVLMDMTQLELKVYIPESDVGKVRLNNPARVRVDAFPDRYFDATVTQVDQRAQFTPKDIHMPEERTQMVFGVTLSLQSPEGYLKPGMPADAWIRWRDDIPWLDEIFVPTS